MRADDHFELRRRIDGLVYRFAPSAARHGRPAWKRVDLDVFIAWVPERGWRTVDAAGTVNGRAWDAETQEQGVEPPEGEWISKKADKSYVYDLVRVAAGSALKARP